MQPFARLCDFNRHQLSKGDCKKRNNIKIKRINDKRFECDEVNESDEVNEVNEVNNDFSGASN